MYASIIGGVIGSAAGTSITVAGDAPWWVVLIASILPTLLGFILELVIGILRKKGIIDSSTADSLKEKSDKISEIEIKKEASDDDRQNNDATS